jgi:hypothetical protein
MNSMICPNCTREIVPQAICPHCQGAIPNLADATPPGDAFLPAKRQNALARLKRPALVLTTLLAWPIILEINYIRAMRWAGVMNAESSGYMIGGCLTALFLGWLTIFLVDKGRHKKSSPVVRSFGISLVALVFSFLALAGSKPESGIGGKGELKRQVGNLIKEAAGKQPHSANTNWWDGPSRDFFHDIIVMNEQYTAEVAKLDQSSLKNLYSPGSYSSRKGMGKIVAQLQAALAVDQKYSSLDPILQAVENRVRSADAPDAEKEGFLKGLKESANRSLAPRNETFRTGKNWMEATIDLYQFTIDHSPEYSVRGGKLYFQNTVTQEGFTSRQSKALALREEFLKARHEFKDLQKGKLEEYGVSRADLNAAPTEKAK